MRRGCAGLRQGGGQISILSKMVREGLTEKVTSGYILEG